MSDKTESRREIFHRTPAGSGISCLSDHLSRRASRRRENRDRAIYRRARYRSCRFPVELREREGTEGGGDAGRAAKQPRELNKARRGGGLRGRGGCAGMIKYHKAGGYVEEPCGMKSCPVTTRDD